MKYTKLERNWVMYDVGNSALVLLNTSVVPIYFNAINTGASSADLVVAWGNAQTIASLVIAMLMPILGALADYAGNKIKFFSSRRRAPTLSESDSSAARASASQIRSRGAVALLPMDFGGGRSSTRCTGAGS